MIEQSAPAELAGLAPVAYPLERLVIPVDVRSFHNAAGLEELLLALRASDRRSVAIELYGPARPEGLAGTGITYRGWVESIRDVYEGNTGVVITNRNGSGIPNKAVEASSAGRPVLAHSSLRDSGVPLRGSFVWYQSVSEIPAAIGRLVSGEVEHYEQTPMAEYPRLRASEVFPASAAT